MTNFPYRITSWSAASEPGMPSPGQTVEHNGEHVVVASVDPTTRTIHLRHPGAWGWLAHRFRRLADAIDGGIS